MSKNKVEDFYGELKGLGKGGSGTTYKAKRLEDGETVAIKILKKAERYESEISISKLPNHENVLSYETYKQLDYKGEARIVLEGPYFESIPLMGHGSEVLQKLTMEEKISIMLGISKAIEHLHKNKRLHRDIKPENVLIKKSNGKSPIAVKLIDYGVCKDVSKEFSIGITETKDFIGTERTSSPNALKSSRGYNKLDDIYSAGVTFIEILLGHEWDKDMTPGERKEYSYDIEFGQLIKDKLETPLWLSELLSMMTFKNDEKRIMDMSIVAEALSGQRHSRWWLNILENSYSKSKTISEEWMNRKVVAQCTNSNCKMIYTYRGEALADKIKEMGLKWQDIKKDHYFKTQCGACCEQKVDFRSSTIVALSLIPPRYFYYPGRVIEVSDDT